mmetsp:Transcript_28594/g.43961  ORF Transcript_28594/g.43961 Transcript_28594/m.43961 type:complete len:177 (-) Transcript_28594:149-679(-)
MTLQRRGSAVSAMATVAVASSVAAYVFFNNFGNKFNGIYTRPMLEGGVSRRATIEAEAAVAENEKEAQDALETLEHVETDMIPKLKTRQKEVETRLERARIYGGGNSGKLKEIVYIVDRALVKEVSDLFQDLDRLEYTVDSLETHQHDRAERKKQHITITLVKMMVRADRYVRELS